jgi:SAM-dependent methyltransferase
MRPVVFIKKSIPPSVYRTLRSGYRAVDHAWRFSVVRQFEASKAAGGAASYECPVCDTRVRRFVPLANGFPMHNGQIPIEHTMPAAMIHDAETMNAEQHFCPICRAMDRDRLYALFISGELKNSKSAGPLAILDFAPSRPLREFLLNASRFKYRSADIVNDGVDDRVDIQSMPIYADGAFDCFICSHVLEHVPRDRQAMRELRRILKPGGWGIVMVPIFKSLISTIEDPAATDPADRLRRFGQEDHVRAYAKADFVERLGSAGFSVRQLGRGNFDPGAFEKYGIAPGSVLYIVR